MKHNAKVFEPAKNQREESTGKESYPLEELQRYRQMLSILIANIGVDTRQLRE